MENDKVYYMRNISDARCPKNCAAFILKGEENKKQLTTINLKKEERGGNLMQKKLSPRDRGREEHLSKME